MRSSKSSSLLLVGLTFTLLILGLLISRITHERIVSGSGDWPTETPPRPYPDPIFQGGTAVALTLAELEGKTVYSETVRLVSYGTFRNWAAILDPHYPTHVPIWVVGVLGDDLTLGDFLLYSQHLEESVAGGFFAWDATSGDNVALGRYYDTGSRQHSSLVALPTESLTILTATPRPIFMPGTAEPTGTFALADVATMDAALTAIAAATPTPTWTPPIPWK